MKSKRGLLPDLPQITRDEVVESRQKNQNEVHIAPEVKQCLVSLADETRNNPLSLQGISTRSLVLALHALQARAFLQEEHLSLQRISLSSRPISSHIV